MLLEKIGLVWRVDIAKLFQLSIKLFQIVSIKIKNT